MGGKLTSIAGRCLSAAAIACVLLSGVARADSCQRADFEAVVDEASNTLLTMTQSNMPKFQGRLRDLKAKRSWSNEQFIKEGATFVRDERIAAYDEQSEQLLLKINTQGGDGADCKVLDGLKAAMGTLVEAQQAKWKYMFDKIETELQK
mgnify:CR=1 FL=1